MSRFKNQERVQIIRNLSNYHGQYGTVVETDSASVRLIVDGEDRSMRFWDTELVPAPHSQKPDKELTQTQKYLRELDEDTKLLIEAVNACPVNSSLRKDLDAFANSQAKIVYNLKLVLGQDGVTLWEDEDGGK